MENKYRSEQFSGLEVTDPIDVMTFEIFELENSDILEYIMEKYLDKNSSIYKRCQHICYLLNNAHEDEVEEHIVNHICQELIQIISNKYDTSINYVLWLTNRDAVIDFYCKNENEFEIDEYDTSNGIILSDINYDGCLFGFPNKPKLINKEIYYRN